MKGVLLAGGSGTRLHPLTKVTNKHLLPVGNDPMIIHSIKKLTNSDIRDIMVITGTEHMGDLIALLGSGKEYGCQITYRVQDSPDGIAGALSLCENFCQSDDFIVILGDNIFEDSLDKSIELFISSRDGFNSPFCLLNLTEADDPKRFGVPTLVDNKIVEIIEKPDKPKSNYCVTGVYLYDCNVFKFLKKIKKSNRGEFEITDVNNLYIKEGNAGYNIFTGWWTDAGTHESYQLANRLSS